MTQKIRIGIAGYGNLGRGVEAAIGQNEDMELVAVFSRRDPASVQLLSAEVPVYAMQDVAKYTEQIDVMILCGGSKSDLPEQGPALAALFNTVDSFDTHAKIPEYFEAVDQPAREHGKTALLSVGWDPAKNIPSAVRKVFWRILLFYIFAILVISLIIPYNSPRLLSNEISDISVSPFTLVFENAGLAFAAALMNAVILTAVLSAGSSGMYASTRMLFALAKEGKAPKVFAKLSSSGVPRNALYATTLIAALCFLSYIYGENTVYLWLLNASGMTGFIAWLGIAVSHYRFRKGYVAQGRNLNDLPYQSSFFPYGPIFAFGLCLIITLGQYYDNFRQGNIVWGEFIATYIGIIIFLVIWAGYKLSKKTRFVAYQEMQFPEAVKSPRS
ncbi:amino acid permease [Thiopseudomonas alkaliphila]|uniref:amino acid permease n=1 Tax=Thiopseudomonas alkaliphila TaxID=1697053 RepID=UPI0009BAFF97